MRGRRRSYHGRARSKPVRCGACINLLTVAEKRDPGTCQECGTPLCMDCEIKSPLCAQCNNMIEAAALKETNGTLGVVYRVEEGEL